MNATFPGLEEIKTAYRDRCVALSKDIENILPPWARAEAGQIFKKRKLIICGSVTRSEIRVLANNADVIGIVDDFATGTVFGIPIMDSEAWIDLVRKDKSIVSCVLPPNSRAYNYFMRQCIQWELPFLDPLQVLHLIRRNGIDTRGENGRYFVYGLEFFDFALQNHEKLVALSDHLADRFSAISWFCMLMYRLTLNPFYLEYCAVNFISHRFSLNSYEINRCYFKFSDEEVFVDGGANIGYSLEQFLNAVNGNYKRIYAFDPLAYHVSEIRARLDRIRDNYLSRLQNDIIIQEKGLWSEEGSLRLSVSRNFGEIENYGAMSGPANTAHFVETGFSGHLYDAVSAQEKASLLPVTSLDQATDRDATFIKLEIEGSELMALRGALETIQANRPQISLAVYHKPDDFVTLTEFMLNLDMDYKFGFRQHNTLIPESGVLYCHY